MSESGLIRKHFGFPCGPSVILGPGDDAAVVDVGGCSRLAISTDTLVEGVHFLAGADPATLGRKCLSVSLSDMAAMGAAPLCATVALTHPGLDSAWAGKFSEGLSQVAHEHSTSIVGGDLTSGAKIAVTVTVAGKCDGGHLTRSGASPGDDVWLSGFAGEASLGLAVLRGDLPDAHGKGAREAVRRHLDPEPRVRLGLLIAGVASAAIDTSDGLWKSLELLSESSGVGLEVAADDVPRSGGLLRLPAERQDAIAFGASDDYELLFASAERSRGAVASAAEQAGVQVSRIGKVTGGSRVALMRDGKDVTADIGPSAHEHWQ